MVVLKSCGKWDLRRVALKKRGNDATSQETLSVGGNPFLGVKVGANFEGEAPSLEGMWKFEEPRDGDKKKIRRKYEKAYFSTVPWPLLEVRHAARVANYSVPYDAVQAISWECMLNRFAWRSEEGDKFFMAFGRHGEEKPFTFNQMEDGRGRKHFLRLLIRKDTVPPFAPLYIKLFIRGVSEPLYCKVNIEWLPGDVTWNRVRMEALEVAESEVPEHLACLTREKADQLD